MSQIWSKILQPEWSFPFNCYEVGHTWTPSCTDAMLECFETIFTNSVSLYAPLYLGSQLFLQRKITPEAFLETAKNTLRSSSFLAFNGFVAIGLFCAMGKLTGRHYYTLTAAIPMTVASLCAIMIEKPSRRPQLAVYCANIASECFFKQMVTRGLFTPIKHGETILFTLTMSLLLYMIKKNGYNRDPISYAIRLILGRHEAARRRPKAQRQVAFTEPLPVEPSTQSSNGKNGMNSAILKACESSVAYDTNETTQFNRINGTNGHTNHPNHIAAKSSQLRPGQLTVIEEEDEPHSAPLKIIEKLNYVMNDMKLSHVCPHGDGCFQYWIKGGAAAFAMGWLAQFGLTAVTRPAMIAKRPGYLAELARRQSTVNFGLFLGCFAALYKATNCGLRSATGKIEDWHAAIGGLIAGPSMLFSPNPSITLHILWKTIETMYCAGVRRGFLPNRLIVNLLYAISTTELFYVAILEPYNMRPSYLRFLERMIGKYAALLNRMVLDVFGTHASEGYEEFFPNLDPKLMSRHFQEQIFVWILQNTPGEYGV